MEIIKSYSFKQDQILDSISRLYLSGSIDLDLTYGRGGFYRKLPAARFKFDIYPLWPGMVEADAGRLPVKSNSVRSVVFDPPFLPRKGMSGLMCHKYGAGGRPKDVWNLYRQGINESARVLRNRGILVVKCQDCIMGRTQYMSHVEVCNQAVAAGLYPIDLFVSLARSRPRAWNHKKQIHSRKFHCYFWVFKKAKRNIPWS